HLNNKFRRRQFGAWGGCRFNALLETETFLSPRGAGRDRRVATMTTRTTISYDAWRRVPSLFLYSKKLSKFSTGGSRVSGQKTDSSKRRTPNTEHRMSNAEFSRQLLTGKVTIKNPV